MSRNPRVAPYLRSLPGTRVQIRFYDGEGFSRLTGRVVRVEPEGDAYPTDLVFGVSSCTKTELAIGVDDLLEVADLPPSECPKCGDRRIGEQKRVYDPCLMSICNGGHTWPADIGATP